MTESEEHKETGKIFIVTGMSGAGKSQALKCFEDFGYYPSSCFSFACIKFMAGSFSCQI